MAGLDLAVVLVLAMIEIAGFVLTARSATMLADRPRVAKLIVLFTMFGPLALGFACIVRTLQDLLRSLLQRQSDRSHALLTLPPYGT